MRLPHLCVLAFLALGCSADDSEPSTQGQPAGPDLGDEFDGDLSVWEVLNPEAAATKVADGQLQIEPAPNSLWFNDRAGALVYQGVQGDFMATTVASARKLSDPTAPPDPQFRLGGLMARAPGAARGENYVFIVVGADGDNVSIETKTTLNGASTFDGPPYPSGDAELRICRIGARFSMLFRRDGSEAWQEQASFDRPDLPSVLQVGPMGYANTGDPDLRVSFDFVRFSEPDDAEACLL